MAVLTLAFFSFCFIGSGLNANADYRIRLPLVSSEHREEQVREYRERLKAHESDFTETKWFAISPEEMSPKMQQAPIAAGK